LQKKILGLNSGGPNTAAVLLVDGEIVYAVEEERLTREKQTRSFPTNAIKAILKFAGAELEDLDAVAINWNPAINLEAPNVPQNQRARYMGEIYSQIPYHLMSLKSDNTSSRSQQTVHFLDNSKIDIHYIAHHMSHASCFFSSPFESAAVLTTDAFGEKQSITFSEGKGNKLNLVWSQEFPHSLGSFYSVFTEYLGFVPSSEEWKLMGASSYGDAEKFYNKLLQTVKLEDKGGFELDLTYFNHFQFYRPGMFTSKLAQLLEIEPRAEGAALTQDHYDLAAAAQKVFEDIYFHLLSSLHEMTGQENVIISGGAALNCVANGMVLEKTSFLDIFVPPVPDDSGGAMGAAYYLYNHIMEEKRGPAMSSNYLGPEFSNEEVVEFLNKSGVPFVQLEDPAKGAAEMISDGKIIGWFQGRLEYGDRALGGRSILADPRDPDMKRKVNATIKYREDFRPFAPSIHIESIEEYFENAVLTPFMEKASRIRPEKHKIIPAVTHVDGTGRLQTVSKDQNSLYWNLINEFKKITGVPIVLNTSFNLKGEPIVCSPKDAIRTFFTSGLDGLFLGNCLVKKK
jgi:carbamoyltransferase